VQETTNRLLKAAAGTVSIVLRALVRAYQLVLSPLLGTNCRFAPSCSEYALEALDRHGAARGAWLTAKRLCRCHPWGGHGFDPVPEHPHHKCQAASATRGMPGLPTKG